jgi:nucleotide-binding universal stress UspA family protein
MIEPMITSTNPITVEPRHELHAELEAHGPKVLLATDDSDAARSAEAWIRRLRWAQGPTVDVLSVAPRPSFVARIGLQTYRTAVREAVREGDQADLLAAQRIANAVGLRLQDAGTAVRTWARQGHVAEEIVALAGLERTDLVVVADRSRPRGLLGRGRTVSDEVARRAGQAVLIVRDTPAGDGPLPSRIAVLAQTTVGADEVVRWLARVGWLAGASVTTYLPDAAGDGSPETFRTVDLNGVDLVAVSRSSSGLHGDLATRLGLDAGVSVLAVGLQPLAVALDVPTDA